MLPIRLGLPCFGEQRSDIVRAGRGGIDMHARIIGLLGALLLFAACSSPPPEAPSGPPGPPGGAGGVGSRNIVPGSQQDLEASAGDRVLFAFDRSDITSEAQQILARQADWLRRYPNVTVTIEGHCDERGTREYNLALGARRAQAARAGWVALGIDPARLQTVSYGNERPAVLGDNEAAWTQNRRAVWVTAEPGLVE